ncbi:MAG: DUF2771 domain-containing protein [Corynebacterium sp.]|nr:DUF2771 domain-containing protein [Corynebacterium sp.]
MATRKQARRQTLLQVLALIIGAIIIVVAAVVFQSWVNSRPGTEPRDLHITASVGEQSIEVSPYLVCEPGTECPEGDIPNLEVGKNDTLVIELPADISRHQWQILSIYDDPGANNETLHGPGDTSRVEIPGSVAPIEASTGETPHLMLVEVSAVLVGHDAAGVETPFSTVFSLTTMSPEELAATDASSSGSN